MKKRDVSYCILYIVSYHISYFNMQMKKTCLRKLSALLEKPFEDIF